MGPRAARCLHSRTLAALKGGSGQRSGCSERHACTTSTDSTRPSLPASSAVASSPARIFACCSRAQSITTQRSAEPAHHRRRLRRSRRRNAAIGDRRGAADTSNRARRLARVGSRVGTRRRRVLALGRYGIQRLPMRRGRFTLPTTWTCLPDQQRTRPARMRRHRRRDDGSAILVPDRHRARARLVAHIVPGQASSRSRRVRRGRDVDAQDRGRGGGSQGSSAARPMMTRSASAVRVARVADDAPDGDGCFDGVAVLVEADVAEDAVLDSRLEQLLGD